ncbi:unnamed protein product [Phytophthora fragariaefolia]|uniref:Unnamed protein product n=1 Tax=Phytophthora fragariaefolia TaxID=1490495 RepID=A0A9W7CTS3_9STRA|nr:unnamed protein product [Phytophthora fragariaefolia]
MFCFGGKTHCNGGRGGQETGGRTALATTAMKYSHFQTCTMVSIYTANEKQATIALVQAGSSIVAVAKASGIHERTVRKWLAAAKEGKYLTAARPGPKPFLPEAAEQHLYDWAVGRQLVGHSVGRSHFMPKAQEIALLCSGKSIGWWWYKRFKESFPSLTRRSAQSLVLKRNCIVSDDITTLFNTLAKLVIELNLDHKRLFNMDETAFQKQLTNRRVVAIRGSSNVWTTEPTANFHLTVVACGNEAGFMVPPAFILPGKTISSQLMTNCSVSGAAVTTSPSGFINLDIFEEWLHLFSRSVPASIPRPLVLILDGCGSHYSTDVVKVADALDILLVFLPLNGTPFCSLSTLQCSLRSRARSTT